MSNETITHKLDKAAGTALAAHELRERHRRFLAAATSDNTRRAYRSAVAHFLSWGGMLPADDGTITRYLLAYADQLNPRTLTLRLAALSQWHLTQGFRDPTVSPSVRKTMKGIRRDNGRPRKRAKALPLEDLQTIVSRLESTPTPATLRDSALLQIGYFGAFRRQELVDLKAEHLHWEREGLRIELPRSKTDQEGEGIEKAIPYADGGVCRPAEALERWIEHAGIEAGILFRKVDRWGNIGSAALNPGSVNEILRRRAEEAALPYAAQLSGHSLRRGMATSALRAGADLDEIMRQGGWRKEETVRGYIEEADAFTKNAAGILLRNQSSKA